MNSPTYYTLLTAIGAAEHAYAQAFGTTVSWTHIAVGDGNGAQTEPTEHMTALVHEVHRVPISSLTVDAENPNWLIVEAVLPADIGGWTIREQALIGGRSGGGKVLAIGNFPPTYKPMLIEGAAKDLVIRMIVEVSSAALVNMTINPGIALATATTVVNAVAAHEGKADPHPQYLTQPRGDARYRLKSEPIAATDLWIDENTAISLPSVGGLRIHNVRNSNLITLDATNGVPNKTAIAVANISGTCTIENAAGVRVNIPKTSNNQALNYCILANNGVSQGIWSSATYGVVSLVGSLLGMNTPVNNELVAAVDVGNNIVVAVVIVGSGLALQAINVDTGAKGVVTAYASGFNANGSNAGFVGAWKTATYQLVVIGSTEAVTASINATDLSITFGTKNSAVGPFVTGWQISHYASSTRLAAAQFLLAGVAPSTGVLRCQVLNVDTGTGGITCSAYADGPEGSGSNRRPEVAAASATAALALSDKGAIGITITAGVPTFGAAALVMPSGISAGNLRPVLAGVTSAGNYAVAYCDSTALTSYKFAVVSTSGTTATWGAPVTVTEQVSMFLRGEAKFTKYPNCWYQATGGGRQTVFQNSADSYLVANVKLMGFAVSGTTVTAGAAVNASATASAASKLPDGTWVYSEQVSGAPVTKSFTMAGNVITPGSTLFASYSADLSGFNVNCFAGKYKVGGVYESYPPLEPILFPLNAGGIAVTAMANSSNIKLLEKFI